jgi:hypothetical protein
MRDCRRSLERPRVRLDLFGTVLTFRDSIHIVMIADEKAHLALTYIAAATRGGGVLTVAALEVFATAPGKADARYENVMSARMSASFVSIADAFGRGELISGAERWADYLVRLSWAKVEGDSIRLTVLGKSVLQDLERPKVDVDSDNPISVIIDPKDPFAHIRVFELISSQSGGTLVDPYIGAKELIDVLSISSVSMVLTGDKKKGEHALMAKALSIAEEPPEVRFLPQVALHDRFFIPDMGDVISFGSSLNTLAKRPGVVMPLGDPAASKAIREVYGSLWKGAVQIVPAVAEG